MKIDHITVGTDLSDQSAVLYAHVAAFAGAFEATATLVYVDELDDLGLPESDALTAHFDAMRQAATTQLELAERAVEKRGVEADRALLVGRPWKMLLELAEARASDLIAIGKPRHAEPRLLGSTTTRLVRHAPVPVLVVDAAGYAEAPETVAYRRVFFPTDFSAEADRGLAVAAGVAATLDADLVLVHVIQPGPNLLRLAIDGSGLAESASALRGPMRGHVQRQLDAAMAQVPEARVESLVLEGPSVPRAISAAASEETDLIVIPSHGRGALEPIVFGSTSEQLLQLTTRPVLVLRRPWLEAQEGEAAAA